MAQQYVKDQPEGFSNTVSRVAVVGATGTVGSRIVDELLKTGKHTVTALTRGFKDSDNIPSGLQVAQVNYDDEQSLVKALTGQDFLIITLSTTAPPDTQEKIVAGAVKAGVKWIMPNSWSPDFMDQKFAEENLTWDLNRRGIDAVEAHGGKASWIAITCGFWYEFSLAEGPEWYGFDFQNNKVTFYDDGEQLTDTSTWARCGIVVAKLLSLPIYPKDEADAASTPTLSRWANKPLYTSSFNISQRDMLDSLNRVMGRTDADWTIEHEASDVRVARGMKEMKSGNRIGFGTVMYARTFFPSGEGNYTKRYGVKDDEVLGMPREDLDEATERAVQMVKDGDGPYAYFRRGQ